MYSRIWHSIILIWLDKIISYGKTINITLVITSQILLSSLYMGPEPLSFLVKWFSITAIYCINDRWKSYNMTVFIEAPVCYKIHLFFISCIILLSNLTSQLMKLLWLLSMQNQIHNIEVLLWLMLATVWSAWSNMKH